MPPKLSLCLIVRDEEENLVNCLDSIRGHVDEIVVVDTGSEDRTREVAKSYGASVYQFDHHNHPESFFQDTEEACAAFDAPAPYSGMWCLADFGAARAASFRYATGDYVVWMDADDVLEGADQLRSVVERMHASSTHMCYLPYNYARDHLGRVTFRQWRERIIRRGTALWVNAVHEVLIPTAPLVIAPPRYEAPVYSHRRKADRKTVPNRNLKILLRQVAAAKQTSTPIDPRAFFYLGQESRYVDAVKSIGYFEEYLLRSGFPEERASAHMALGQILEGGTVPGVPMTAALLQAQREYATAAAEMPENPDGMFALARVAYQRDRWFDCIRYSEAAFKVGNTDTMLGTNPMDRVYRPHAYYNFALNKAGRVQEALDSCRAALAAMPDDPGVVGGSPGALALNAKIYAEHLEAVRLATANPVVDTSDPGRVVSAMPKISLHMIVLNESANLPRCLDSVAKHVDEIVIVDTGSTDNTKEIAASYGAKVFDCNPETHPQFFFLDDGADGSPPPHSGKPTLGHFAGARALALSHCTGEYTLWIDADDVLENAERIGPIVDGMAAGGIDVVWLPYHYGHDDAGRVICLLSRERLVRRGAMKWVNAIHEVMVPVGEIKSARIQDMVVRHCRSQAKSASVPHRNYKVLLRHVKQREDARTLFYFGNEARFVAPEQAIIAYERYVEISGSPEERSLARCYLGEIYEGQKKIGKAQANFAASATDCAQTPDGWFGLARLAFHRNDWGECVRLSEEGIRRGNPETVIMINPLARTFGPYLYYSVALNSLGRVQEAYDACLKGLAVVPEDPMLRHNLGEFRKFLDAQAAAGGQIAGTLSPLAREMMAFATAPHGHADAPVPLEAATLHNMGLRLWKECLAQDEPASALALLDALPISISETPSVEEARAKTLDLLASVPIDAVTVGEHLIRGLQSPMEVLRRARARDLAVFSVAQPVSDPAKWNAPKGHARRFSPRSLHAALAVRRDVEVDRLHRVGTDLVVTTVERKAQRPDALDVVFWIGNAVEAWSPNSPSTTGIGGSETACIEMAKWLTRMGHRVVVYSDCREAEGWYDSVEYRRYESFVRAKCDVFIASRQPWAADRDIDAKVKLLWVHDIHVGQPMPDMHRWLLKYDRILCLTEWHKQFFLQCYPFVHPETVVVTRNGIDPARFMGEVEIATTDLVDAVGTDLQMVHVIPPKTNKLIYSSSANRGLDVLLDVFPRIRAEVPDAELHVFYGFESWEASARMSNNAAELAQIEWYRKRLAETSGVVARGRVNQATLAHEMLTAKVWSFPTAFTETFCCHPDTMISVPGDHRSGTPRVRIADLVGKSGFPVYAYDETEHRFRIATATRVWQTKIAEEMVAIELDDGQVLRLTPEHPVMDFDGAWVQAGELLPGKRLMALHHRYEVKIKDANGTWVNEHRLVGEWIKGQPLLTDEHVDHLDPLRLDNRPEALQIMTKSQHHSKTHRGSVRSKRAEAARFAGLQRWARENPEAVSQRGTKNSNALWAKIAAMTESDRRAWLAQRGARKSEAHRRRLASDPDYAKALLERQRENGKRGALARWNHKVVSVTRIPGGPVYDMEVAELHNFVADGVVVHNCITAVEAQAAGCIPVTSAVAALPETARYGVLLPGSSTDPAYQDAFVAAVVGLLKDDERRNIIAKVASEWALTLSWESLAREWESMFFDLAEQCRGDVPRYEGMVHKAA